MIYHITYLSDGLRVKGYIAFPADYFISKSDLRSLLERFFNFSPLSVREIASSFPRSNMDASPKKYPALLYCRGGIGKVGRVKTDWIEKLASLGYIVFAPSYRGNEGGEGRDEFGGAEQADVESAFHFIGSLPMVDPHRISIMGFSRGAINATQAAVRIEGIHRLILWGGVSNLAKTYEERIDLRRMLKRVVGGSPGKVPQAYIDRSPLLMAEQITVPVLIMHGTRDLQVDFSHGLNMHLKLQKLKVPVDIHCYRGYGHHFSLPVFEAVVERMVDWIDTFEAVYDTVEE